MTVPSGQAPAGRTVDIAYRFAVGPSAPPFAEDYTVFVHALDEDGDQLWTGDHEPPTPTSQWKPGSVIEYTQAMTVPRRAPEGRVTIAVGIHSPRSRDRLPLSGDDMGRRAYRVGSLDVIEKAGTLTIFLGGWNGIEAPDGEQGIEWRWTKGEGAVWMRRSTGPAVLVVALDQPATVFETPQQVTIRNGDAVLDTFALPRGRLERRRIPVPPPTAPGDNLRLEITVAVDKTFVPARVAGSESSDTRELGVRVFDVHLEEDAP